MKALGFLLMVCFIWSAGCASFRSDVASEDEMQPRAVIRETVAFSTAGFRDEERASDVLREELESLGMRVDPDSETRLRVARFEMEAGNPLGLLNALVTIFTAGIVPFYHPIKQRIVYTVFERGEMKLACEYETKNNEFFGLLLIPLSPFFWPGSQERALLRETAQKAAVCAGLRRSP